MSVFYVTSSPQVITYFTAPCVLAPAPPAYTIVYQQPSRLAREAQRAAEAVRAVEAAQAAQKAIEVQQAVQTIQTVNMYEAPPTYYVTFK